MSKKKAELITLDTPMEELENKLLSTTDTDELKNIIDIFNMNIRRKDIVRTGKLSELQDKISAQIEERLTKRAGEFSNKDLLDYFKVIQDTISKSDTSMDGVDTPAIQINQSQLNINMKEPELDRDSRERVANAVKSILAKCTPADTEVIDVEPVVVEEK